MSLTIILIIFILVYILRIYSMKFMIKKQPRGKIYYPWSYPLLFTTYAITYFGAFAEYFFGRVKYPLEINILGAIFLFLGVFITGWSIKTVGSSWSQHIEIKKQHRLAKAGPYKYMRNPYYYGVIFELLGACFLYNGYLALWFLLVIHLPLVAYRGWLEVKVSRKYILGYRQYAKSVRNLL